jgi:photosystem II stability/assembly factor-like uncharacterized protein
MPVRLALCLLLFASTVAATAQDSRLEPLLNGLNWRAIGPATVGGRINDVSVVETDPATAYVASASGGLWKTTNAGTTFKPVGDTLPTLTIGAVAVAPSDPSVVWVGTGEANNRQSSSWGSGVFRSTDGGETWIALGLEATHHIQRVVVDPRNADVAYVAAVGKLWGPNPERGLYRTTDGGKSWTKPLYVDADTGCTEIVLDPSNPSTLYAAMYQRRRTAYGFTGAGPGSGLFKSTDAGATWTKLEAGLPKGPLGRIGLAVSRKAPQTVYATVEANEGGVYRSDDSGATWRRMSETNPRPMYFSQIRVDPNDTEKLWLAGVSFASSSDGGKTWRSESSARIHADIHAIWIDPRDSRHLLVGCDGGLHWSHDGGKTYDMIATLPLSQFYGVGFDFSKPYRVAGGLQDNGSWIGPSSSRNTAGIGNADWKNLNGGDGFQAALDPTDPSVVYVESQNGNAVRVNPFTGESRSVRPRAEGGEALRFDWNTPILISPHNPRRLYIGGNRLFISDDRGASWRRTGDLTTQPDLKKMPIMGQTYGTKGYPFQDIPSDYGQIVTLTESPCERGVIYAGTDDGNLQVSRDDGKSWANVAGRVPGLRAGAYVSKVHASPHARGRVYASFDNHRSGDFTAYAYVSDDYGATWRSIGAGLTPDTTVSVVRDHPRNPDVLFMGTERGAWVSIDRGARWTRFPAPLPALRVDDLQVHPRDNDLILATHARGIWILDDIAALEQAAVAASAPVFKLLTPKPAITYRMSFSQFGAGNRVFAGPNAPQAGMIRYVVGKGYDGKGPEEMRITTRKGELVRKMTLIPTEAGLNRVTWDLRWAAAAVEGATQRRAPVAAPARPAAGQARQAQGRRTQGSGARTYGSTRGPRVLPGAYVVHLRLGAEEQTAEITVEDDPFVSASTADRRRHFEAIRDLSLAAAQASYAGSVSTRLTAPLKALKEGEAFKTAPEAQRKAVAAYDAALTALTAGLRDQAPAEADRPGEGEAPARPAPGAVAPTIGSRVSQLSSAIDAFTETPVRSHLEQARTLTARASALYRSARRLAGPDLERLNKLLAAAKLPPLQPAQDDFAAAGGDGFVAEEVGEAE